MNDDFVPAPAAVVLPPTPSPPSPSLSFAPQQAEGMEKISKWLRQLKGSSDYRQVFKLFGYAGTGKSFMLKGVEQLVAELPQQFRRTAAWANKPLILYLTYTGKAALVLQMKGLPAQTIHSAIYKIDENSEEDDPKFILNPDSIVRYADLVVIDEVSMVNEEIGKDLEYFGTKILVVGDQGQLPPISGAGYFTSGTPDHVLTEIHRQALDSPIIRLSMDIRSGKGIKPGRYGESEVFRKPFVKAGGGNSESIIRQFCAYSLASDVTICGLNRSRHLFNKYIRGLTLIGSPPGRPIRGDKLICLRNNREKALLNGGFWSVESEPEFDGRTYDFDVKSLDLDNTKAEVSVPYQYFTQEEMLKEDLFGVDHFDFGYCITAHKSQGSQWPRVFIYNENFAFRENAARWLYTAITRAASSVVIAV